MKVLEPFAYNWPSCERTLAAAQPEAAVDSWDALPRVWLNWAKENGEVPPGLEAAPIRWLVVTAMKFGGAGRCRRGNQLTTASFHSGPALLTEEDRKGEIWKGSRIPSYDFIKLGSQIPQLTPRCSFLVSFHYTNRAGSRGD